MKQRKKLIEVALPLEAINVASAREKSIRHGHPSTLHLWWARRPLAAARAVIFAQMVDDPSEYGDVLLSDPQKKRRAERVLRERTALWNQAKQTADEARRADLPVVAPGPQPRLDEILQEHERERLFDIIEKLVLWENTTNEKVLQPARDEIWQSWRRTCAENADHPQAGVLFDRHTLPAFHDPFAGGGALPLEAQRLGLESHASDLNPVAVLINKAMIEIPPKFAAKPPVNRDWQQKPDEEKATHVWQGAHGLAEDVRFYGQWMRDEAQKRIGHLYPPIEITSEMIAQRPDLKPYAGQKLTVIAWLWARTVKSPNPAFAHVDVPLASTFMLSTKKGKEAFVEPILENGDYRFAVKVGQPADAEAAQAGTKLSRGANFRCLMSSTPLTGDYIKAEGVAGRMGARMMAIVAEGKRGRVYLSPTPKMEAIARQAQPEWKPETTMPENPRWFSPPYYGLEKWGDLFTPRQLVALTTFSDLVQEARLQVLADALAAGLSDDEAREAGSTPTRSSTPSAAAYADAVAAYLAFAVSKTSNRASTLCTFKISVECPGDTFGRQAIPMSWDFAESNTMGGPSGSFESMLNNTVAGLLSNSTRMSSIGYSTQSDAASQKISCNRIVSTDPPYYDNIGYADLSDFFYVWLRRSLQPIYPELFSTLAVPKAEELVATPYRHGGKAQAETFFLDGMTQAMHRLAEQSHPAFPVTIYYAFKQAESSAQDGTASTGWETFLDAVIRAGFAITGTWPMRTERENRKINQGTNALASSIVLVCRRRASDASSATRREFQSTLRAELPPALAHLQRGNIAPVDLAQAAIGPGMAVYTRYARVLDAQGQPLDVRAALTLINETLDEALAEQEGDFDADSRWALAWFDQFGFAEGDYGLAETLSKAKNTSVAGVVEAGFAVSGRGHVRLLSPSELPADWTPAGDRRLTVWDMVHHLIRVLEKDGESAAAQIVSQLGALAEPARELCYRLYTLCERKKRAAEALSYNGLVQSWPEILRLSQEVAVQPEVQGDLFGGADNDG